MTLKLTLNDLEGLRSLGENHRKNMQAKCTKFEALIFISFAIIKKYSDEYSE